MKNFVKTYKAQIIICAISGAAARAILANIPPLEPLSYALGHYFAIPPASVLIAVCAYSLMIQAALLKTNDMPSFFSNGAMASVLATGICLYIMDSVYRNPRARAPEIMLLLRAELTLPYCIAITAAMVTGCIVTAIKAQTKQKGAAS